MASTSGNELSCLKKLLIVDPAHEGDDGAAAEISHLIDDYKLIYNIESKIPESIKYQYFCAALVLTDRVNMTATLHQKLCTLSKILRTIAIVDNSEQGTARVSTLLKNGALYDFHTLPLDPQRFSHMIGHLRGLDRIYAASHHANGSSGPALPPIIGTSSLINAVKVQIGHYANTDFPVLITGESGTGKELAARAIHLKSSRANSPFLAINCAAIPQSLAGSELFGHEKGAFTDAHASRPGCFEQASGGTLFLDEIGDLPLDIQSQLLRVLENGHLYRIGGQEPRKIDVRIIAASNINMDKAVLAGRFRFDLYHRINVLPLNMPPLRDREGDALLLARAFINKIAHDNDLAVSTLSDDAMRLILTYRWPGNVRQLQNAISRAVTLASDNKIRARDLNINIDTLKGHPFMTLAKARADTERALVRKAIHAFRGNISRAASELGVSRVGLYRLMKRHELDHRKMLNGGADHEEKSEL